MRISLLALFILVFFPFSAIAGQVTIDPDQQQLAGAISQIIIVLLSMFQGSSVAAKAVAFVVSSTAVVGTASAIVHGITKVTSVTPSTKDDEYASKVEWGLSWLTLLLSKIALNPKQELPKK